jgi:hypothetical protein
MDPFYTVIISYNNSLSAKYQALDNKLSTIARGGKFNF